MLAVADPFEYPFERRLFCVVANLHVLSEVRERSNLGQHLYAPLVYADEKDAGVETFPVVATEEVDVGEVAGREEEGPGDVGIEEDGVRVEEADVHVNAHVGI